jgi:hypothetical protein
VYRPVAGSSAGIVPGKTESEVWPYKDLILSPGETTKAIVSFLDGSLLDHNHSLLFTFKN